MGSPVPELIEALASSSGITVEEAGRRMVELLSNGELSVEAFLEQPAALVRPKEGVSRYLAQVVWRALTSDYRTIDELVSGISGVIDRDPPVLESASPDSAGIVIPEARILRIVGRGAGTSSVSLDHEAAFEAHVTSGTLRDEEITVGVSRSVNPTAWSAVSHFWVHSSVALYNLEPRAGHAFRARADSFFILEPLRQVNATTIARSLACPKPEIDRMRQGRSHTTLPMIRGLVVHGILERLIDGETSLERCYERALSPFRTQLAALVDGDFGEESFHDEVMRHAETLRDVVSRNPHMLKDPQLEVRRYSPTLGIQGRIDAIFRSGTDLDVVELKTGKRLRPEDHAQVYIYRLLLSDFVRRVYREQAAEIDVTTRLVSSYDGVARPARPAAGFLDVVEARNRLVALTFALGRTRSHVSMPYADYDDRICGVCPIWTRTRCRESSGVFGDFPGADESVDRAYFRELSRLVRQEGWRQGADLAALLDDSRIPDRIRDFRTIEKARCVGLESGTFFFEFPENTSELAVGDRVLLHGGQIASRNFWQGYVRSVEPHRMGIAIPFHNLTPEMFEEEQRWLIDRLSTDLTTEASQTALYDFLASAPDARKRVILGDFGGPIAESPDAVPDMLPVRSEDLNPPQREAVRRAAACSVFHLVWGPPGTGKTRIVPDIVAAVKGDVLLGAFTNTAVDNMLMALLDRDPDARFLRLGRSESSPELSARLGSRASSCFSEDLAQSAPSIRELRNLLDDVAVVAATAHRASSHPYLRQRQFEMVIIDEAGQLTEPLTLGLVMRARRFVLIGDDRQLPPVVRTPGLDVSLFERLKEHCSLERPRAITLLDLQYRMHPAIMEVANRLYYEGRLSAGVEAEDREPPMGSPLLFVPVDAVFSGRSNPSEVAAVGRLVRRLLGSVGPERIGVISPFRAQVALLRQELEGTGVAVDTVERFQGGERDVVVISFVKSRGTDFISDDRRLNVAVTRARCQLILVAHPQLFRGTRFAWVTDYAAASAAENPA